LLHQAAAAQGDLDVHEAVQISDRAREILVVAAPVFKIFLPVDELSRGEDAGGTRSTMKPKEAAVNAGLKRFIETQACQAILSIQRPMEKHASGRADGRTDAGNAPQCSKDDGCLSLEIWRKKRSRFT
jgi:hypothetical protein